MPLLGVGERRDKISLSAAAVHHDFIRQERERGRGVSRIPWRVQSIHLHGSIEGCRSLTMHHHQCQLQAVAEAWWAASMNWHVWGRQTSMHAAALTQFLSPLASLPSSGCEDVLLRELLLSFFLLVVSNGSFCSVEEDSTAVVVIVSSS